MDAIRFEIPGDAIPQPRARSTRGGRMYTPQANGIGTFKRAVGLMARSAALAAGWTRSDAPHEIDVEAIFARPPSHLTSTGGLRKGSPAYPGHRSGDNDNLEKGVWDAITKCGAVWDDDSQIVGNQTRKRYAVAGEANRTVVTIRRLAG